MTTEQTLTYTLLSDSLEGVVKVQKQWGGVVVLYRFPRTARKAAGKVLKTSGIYFLIGEKDGNKHLYVGQSANLSKRFEQHSVNSGKDFWSETLALTAAHKPQLNSAHLDYLENRFHAIAQEAGRCAMVNSTVPPIGPGVEVFSQMMEAYISEAMTMLNLMGYHFLEKSLSSMAIEPQQVKEPVLPVAGDAGLPEEKPQVLAGFQTELTGVRRPKYNFYEMGLKVGDVVVYEDKDPAHRTEATVCAPDKIQVNGEVMTPHALAKRIRQTDNVYAFAYISWKGEKLSTIYNRVYKNYPPKKEEEDTAKLRYCTVAGADAVGRLTEDGGIVVLKGSRICAESKKTCSAMAAALRAEVGEDCITQKDYAFKSLSGAAQFVGGCALNGHICWTETRQEPKRKKG